MERLVRMTLNSEIFVQFVKYHYNSQQSNNESVEFLLLPIYHRMFDPNTLGPSGSDKERIHRAERSAWLLVLGREQKSGPVKRRRILKLKCRIFIVY